MIVIVQRVHETEVIRETAIFCAAKASSTAAFDRSVIFCNLQMGKVVLGFQDDRGHVEMIFLSSSVRPYFSLAGG